MEKERLKLIVRNLESLVQALKSEVYSDSCLYKQTKESILDYDEIFEENLD